jgi:uncharacterized protein YerC
MTHVSRNPLDKDVYYDILDGLYWLMADIKTSAQMKVFLTDFFTKTERIMLAKRLAIALMIVEGYDTELIKKVLKVSTATIYRMREWVDRGGAGLKDGLFRLRKRQVMNDFWDQVKTLIERDFPTTRNVLRSRNRM